MREIPNEHWRFETSRFAVIFTAEEEDMDPADSLSLPEDVAFAREDHPAHWFSAKVAVFDKITGEEIGADYLGGCSYNSSFRSIARATPSTATRWRTRRAALSPASTSRTWSGRQSGRRGRLSAPRHKPQSGLAGSNPRLWQSSHNNPEVQTMAEQEIINACAALGVTMTAEFVPFSQSRNAKPNAKLDEMSLNWRVTLKRNGRDILTTDYGAGIGHCPSYKPRGINTNDGAAAIRRECETGVTWRGSILNIKGPKVPGPNLADVVHSLVSDASAIDNPTFEDWASDFGYDTDSRKAEAIYRACLEIGLKLRAALGDDGMRQLQEACRDY